MLDAEGAGDDIGVRPTRHIGQRAPHVQVGGKKRRRRFRPENQPGRARFAVFRTPAEGRQRVEGLREMVERPILGTQDGNIRLHHRGPFVGRQWRRMHQPSGLQDDGRRQRRYQQEPAPLARHEKCRRHRGVYQHNLERDAVHSGDSRDARERDVVNLRGAQQVPRKAGDVGPRQLDRDPHEWA